MWEACRRTRLWIYPPVQFPKNLWWSFLRQSSWLSLLNSLFSKYIIVNLGMSKNFGNIDFDHLVFPAQMRVDYIRVYQDVDAINIGCNPKNFPTEDYINQFVYCLLPLCVTDFASWRYIEAYTNPNLTTWRGDYGQPFPKNSFIESC